VVVTGGGPGVMEAGNRGAPTVGAPTIGLNIVLPHEQAPNTYITPELCFNFHYFATRKIHFLLRARAVAIFPGGFGTLDEFFETLTLIQTGRMERVPLLLFGKEFWSKVINFEALADAGHHRARRSAPVHRGRQRRGRLGHRQGILRDRLRGSGSRRGRSTLARHVAGRPAGGVAATALRALA
jgi:predicted Rossmann-fold nucleotide-binding protein